MSTATQLDLFDAARPAGATRLDSALDSIRGKFGAREEIITSMRIYELKRS